jgi:hypothetical protein
VVACGEAHRRERHDFVLGVPQAPLGELVAYAAVDQPHRDGLRRVREQVQRDVVVRGRGPVEQRAHEPRLEFLEQAHRLEREASHLGELARVPGLEQALVLGERLLDLGVLRQHGEVGDAEALRGLALGEAVILVAVLDHEARGLARDRLPDHLAADGSSGHG